MFFDTLKAAKDYAKDQTLLCRGRKHKAVACNQWRCDRMTGEYNLHPCYAVILA